MQPTVMLCERGVWGTFPDAGRHIFEPKLDGVRILASKQLRCPKCGTIGFTRKCRKCGAMAEEMVRLVGRSGEDYTRKFPEVVEDLSKISSSFISDGELCSASGDFRSIGGRLHLKEFKIKLNAIVNPTVYHIFDLLNLNGEYLVKRPLRERKRLLETLGEQEHVRTVKPQPLDELIKLVEAQRIEGIVAKNLDSTYELRRSPNWIKFRPAEGFELPIVGYEESDKPGRPFRSLILVWKGRELQASSGLANDDLHYAFEKFSGAKIVRTIKEAGRNKHYFESPVGEAEIVFTSTPNLPVRFPRVVKLKLDR